LFSRVADGISKLYEPEAPQTRKLIAHSGPVYSLSFDPVPGPASPPRYLLSSSADCTVRLWSLETFTNLVVYRGHREPVWAVEWGPRGVYFATASRDRTARLWITDKINAVRIFAGHLSDVNVSPTLPFFPPWLSFLFKESANCLRIRPE
jgi:transcription initiation factor TFIID subunit 5